MTGSIRAVKREYTETEYKFDRVENSLTELKNKVARLEKTVTANVKKFVKDDPCKMGHNYQLIGQTAIFCTKCGDTKKLDLK